MAITRIRLFVLLSSLLLFAQYSNGQTVYYPAQSSALLQSTASDLAILLQRAIPGSHINLQAYTMLPTEGIILKYDSAITDNQSCKIKSDGAGYIQFASMQDNGLNFGIYEYLWQLGFRFYQPGTIWELAPTLLSPYKDIDTTYSCKYRYKSWFITGGHNRWAMDNSNDYPWDIYFGENGHEWALYQRRNNMTGGSRFTGHRDDIMTGTYLAALQTNPCYVACYDGSRQAGVQSVPEIYNSAAMQLWASEIEGKYTQFKNTVLGNPALYINYYRNFNYNYGSIGIEVPDGAHWGNSTDNGSCNTAPYPEASDQQFTLANYTAAKLSGTYPGKRLQLYAYDRHANTPSFNIDSNIDIQVVATGFQSETSARGLLNRWYNRSNNISEYDYLNLTQWSGETPSYSLNVLNTTVQRLQQKNSQGILWEASPAKFASLPYLLTANSSLMHNISVDSGLHEFCNSLFAGAGNTIYTLLSLWGDEKNISIGDWMQDNKYKMPFYLKLVNEADQQTQNASAVVQQRILELKAYLHYMILYYDWAFDQRSNATKAGKAALLCNYLAKTNKLKIINSYFLISTITNRYSITDSIFLRYNVDNGTAYQNGTAPLITAQEINADFIADINTQSNLVQQFNFETADAVTSLAGPDVKPLEKIKVSLGYNNGKDYPNSSQFYINALSAGNFSLQYSPSFIMPGKGYINFTVEAVEKPLQIIKDFSIDRSNGPGVLNISLPAAGIYLLTITSKFKSAVTLTINSNGHYFYKQGPFLGNAFENYRTDLLSLPGYFHIPAGTNKIYFSVNNSYSPVTGFAKPDAINKAFAFKDNKGNSVQPRLVSSSDSSLFYLDIPAGADNSFWQVFKTEQYRLCFINISNLLWYLQRKPCDQARFTIDAVQKYGDCLTELNTTANSQQLQWQVYDGNTWYTYNNTQQVDLPRLTSSNAMVTLFTGPGCFTTQCVGNDSVFMAQKEICQNPVKQKISLYPNPGKGIYTLQQNGNTIMATTIVVYNMLGAKLATFEHTAQFNITGLPAGAYIYRIEMNSSWINGKLVKW